jgi:hypothetical protein
MIVTQGKRSMNQNDQIRREMQEIQDELHSALHDLRAEVGHKLNAQERAEIEDEFQQLDDLLDRLKSGLVWIALFGNTSVGKSAIANSLIDADVGLVGIEHDLTTEPIPYEKPPWMIVDVPGIMGNEINEQIAINEAKKAHGHIFVVKEEPYGPELKLFELVHQALPQTPKIVFVNQWDVIELVRTPDEQAKIRERIIQKMGRFVRSPDDILFGNALTKIDNRMVRQPLPQLLDRMYADAGTLGMVMNVLDPANRAAELGDKVRDKIFEMRQRIARRFISYFATASVAGGFIPFNQLLVTPGILASMVFAIFRILGRPLNKKAARQVSIDLLKACGAELGVEFAAVVVADALLSSSAFLGPVSLLIGALGNMAGLGYYRYRRTAILGEVTIEYVKNNCSWAGQDRHEVILRCKERASRHHMRLKNAV